MGGGILRSAAKAAALIGYRSVGHPAASRASRPSSAVVSAVAPATEAGPSISVASSHNGLLEAAPEIQGLAWEFDDWEVADWEEEEKDVTLDSLHPVPRLVFGPVASLEEAKEATSDLKDALDMVYSTPDTNESTLQAPQESTHSEASSIVPSAPRHVVQAFSLLRGSPEVQDVVASLASDENVWNAVMKNEKVMEFYVTHQSIALNSESDVADDCESSTAETTPNSVFSDFVHNVKVKVVAMVGNITSFFQEILQTLGRSSSSTSTNTDKPFVDFTIGSSFMALAIATILVVLLRRG
ncbi:unnamed protein product [Musa acuminata subsp. burmannicoides]